jgi:hypothetical protein
LPEQAALALGSSTAVAGRRVAVRRIVLGTVLLSTFAAGVAFAFFTLFSRFPFWDDEGKMLLSVQQMLDGRALYDQASFIYGPSYLLDRWVVFSLLGVPLGNDGVRAVALLAWVVAALLLAMTAWRLAHDTNWALGLAAIVWMAGVFQLVVFTNEPGHPQELVVLLLAAAFWIATQLWNTRPNTALALLGAITAALILTKINVGVLFGLSLGMALVSLGPRPSVVWTVLRIAASLAILALPTILMRSRFVDGFGTFCFMITAALLPCCWLATIGVGPSAVRWKHVLVCAVGAAAVASLTLGFAVAHGNTLAGIFRALLIQPWRGFAGSRFGGPLALPRLTVYWSVIGAGLGLGAHWFGPRSRSVLWPLRLFVCALIFTDALVARSWDSQATWIALPLMWLLLVPPPECEPQAKEWLFRLLLAFTTGLQPIQVFPVPGSQVHIGTVTAILVGVVLLLDLRRELEVATRPALPTALIVRIALSLVVFAALWLVLEWRIYVRVSSSYQLPSLATAWSLVGAAAALVVLWGGSGPRRFLPPLRLLTSLLIFGCVAAYGWDTDWTRFALPLVWLLLIPPARDEQIPAGLVFRLLLTLAVCLRPLRILPVDGGPFHLPTWAMLLAGGVLLCDFLEVDLVDWVRRRASDLNWNLVAASLALLFGGLPALVAARTYEHLVPLDLRGCRWTRLSEREATLLTFLAINAEKSSDCFVARIGLMSLHFWADRRPASDFVLGNEWDTLDPATNELLLTAHRDHLRMMFIDNPTPWYLDSHKLEFSKFAAALPAHAFLDFISQHFKQLARVANCRLFVRKERKDLDLYDCAYEAGVDPTYDGRSLLRLKLPEGRNLKGVAAVELVDLASGEQIASTEPGGPAQLLLLFDRGQSRSTSSDRSSAPAALSPDERHFLAYPTELRLDRVPFPALRFLDTQGHRVLTLPVAVEISSLKP